MEQAYSAACAVRYEGIFVLSVVSVWQTSLVPFYKTVSIWWLKNSGFLLLLLFFFIWLRIYRSIPYTACGLATAVGRTKPIKTKGATVSVSEGHVGNVTFWKHYWHQLYALVVCKAESQQELCFLISVEGKWNAHRSSFRALIAFWQWV